jgi:hypothetical protein
MPARLQISQQYNSVPIFSAGMQNTTIKRMVADFKSNIKILIVGKVYFRVPNILIPLY